MHFVNVDVYKRQIFTPIDRISYDVEPARVGQNENYDKLILNAVSYTHPKLKLVISVT